MGNNKYGKHVFRYNVAYILDLVFTCIAIALWLVSGIVILQYFKGVEPRVWVAIIAIPLGVLFFSCHEYAKLTMDIELNCMERIDIQNEILNNLKQINDLDEMLDKEIKRRLEAGELNERQHN